MSRIRRVIISCGGTAGHIFPGLEIAKSLKKSERKIEILFVGAIGKMEMKSVPKHGFIIKGIWIQSLNRKSVFSNILFPFKFFVSIIQSILILLSFKPDVVIGTGGFASGPILLIASFLNYNTCIQEQNYFPGLTNRILAKYVDFIFVAHNGMENFFSIKKIINFGNPVRKSLHNKDLDVRKSRSFFKLNPLNKSILVIGGSLGARPINDVIFELISLAEGKIKKQPNKLPSKLNLIWQTGESDFLRIRSKLEKITSLKSSNNKSLFYINNKNFELIISLHKFIDKMDYAYKAADLVISRSGAIAVAEICYLSIPSILIPSPFVTDDHQYKNAKYLLDNNAALVIRNKGQVEFNKLYHFIHLLLGDKKRAMKMATKANTLFDYDASNKICEFILKNILDKKYDK